MTDPIDPIDFAAQAQLVRRLAQHTGEEQLDAPHRAGSTPYGICWAISSG